MKHERARHAIPQRRHTSPSASSPSQLRPRAMIDGASTRLRRHDPLAPSRSALGAAGECQHLAALGRCRRLFWPPHRLQEREPRLRDGRTAPRGDPGTRRPGQPVQRTQREASAQAGRPQEGPRRPHSARERREGRERPGRPRTPPGRILRGRQPKAGPPGTETARHGAQRG